MGIMNFLGKCEYSQENSLNASCDCLYQSLHMSVFALSSDNQGDSLTFGVVLLICLLGEGKINLGSKSSSYQKCYMCSEIWGRPD